MCIRDSLQAEGGGESPWCWIEKLGRAPAIHVVFVDTIAVEPGNRKPRLPLHPFSDFLESPEVIGGNPGGLEGGLLYDPAGGVNIFLLDDAVGKVLPGSGEFGPGKIEGFLLEGRGLIGLHLSLIHI